MRYNQAAPTMDIMAISISGLCLIHCLALPLMAVTLPVFGVWAENELIHKLFVVFALVVTTSAMVLNIRRNPSPVFLVMAALALVILTASAFAEALHDYEQMLTVLGGVLLALAHGLRLRADKNA